MSIRQVNMLILSGLLLWGGLGCADDKKGQVETPKQTIALPKNGPTAGPAGSQPGKEIQPGGGGGSQPAKTDY